MKLTNALKNILISRLMDANGSGAESVKQYSDYADGVIIDWGLFNNYNDGIAALVNDYGKTVIF